MNNDLIFHPAFISAVVTISLFFMKEVVFEFLKKRKTRLIKKTIFSHAIGRELRENFTAIDDLFRIIYFFRDHRDSKSVRAELLELSTGYKHCTISSEGDLLEMRIPTFDTTWYEKLFSEIVEQDANLASLLAEAYDVIYFLNDKRGMLISLFGGELTPFLRMCTVSLADILPDQRDSSEAVLHKAYFELTGSKLIGK